MASITSSPSDKIGCYQALEYTYTHTIVANANPMSIEVDVKINSSSFRTLYLVAYTNVSEVSGDYTYTFTIDVSKVVQSFFDNNQFFYDTNKSYPYTDVDLTADVIIDIYRYEPDANGVLTRNGTPTTSTTKKFFNSLKSDLTNYTSSLGRKFLTKKTDYRLSTQVTNLIAIFSDSDVTHLRVNDSGDVSIIAMTEDQINIFNLNDYFDSSTTSLILQGGTMSGETFTGTSETLTFKVLTNICEPCGLHFQNEFGANEVFIFKDYEYDISRERSTELYVTDTNLVRMYQGEIVKNIDLERNGFFNNEWSYFQDVATSSIFYIEEVTGTLNEAYSTFNNTPLRSLNGEIDINLSFSYSSEQKIFSN